MAKILVDSPKFKWVDVVNPQAEDLLTLGVQYQIPENIVQDCMQPEHLPKFEQFDHHSFLILRAYDTQKIQDADTIQELTRKVAVFYSSNILVTVRRTEQSYFDNFKARWVSKLNSEHNHGVETVVLDLIQSVLSTYKKPVQELLDELDRFEVLVFKTLSVEPTQLSVGYCVKRQAFVFKRMFRLTHEILQHLAHSHSKAVKTHIQDSQELIAKLTVDIEGLDENIAHLLNLHISLSSHKVNESSHKTNEVMRVLTVFSVFFLPINFIASIFGMNFEKMPELRWEYGYYYALSLMAAVAFLIFLWFRRRGWLD